MDKGSKTYGIGIAGCGTISGTHAQAIQGTKYGKLVAVHSRNKTRLDTFYSRYGGTGFTDYEKFLARSDMDIVVICTPGRTYLDYGERAARAGKHIIGEESLKSLAIVEALYQSAGKGKVVNVEELLSGKKLREISLS